MLPEFYQFHHPTKVIYGEGLVNDFAHELEELGVKNYFIVSDQVLSSLGLIEQIKTGLEEAGFTITGEFYDVPQDASVEAVESISRQATDSGAEGLIAVGGGSVIDATKAANFVFSEGGDLVADYSGASTLTKPLKPFIVIPTTAGTGSENTLIAMIYDVANKTKLAFSDKFLLPDLAVLDPVMTQSLPPGLTASTGMDALTHAVESYVGVDTSPHSEALAVAAIRHIFKYLVRATQKGDDLEARGGMLIAANMAGSSFSHSMVGCVHAMAHAVGGLTRVPHGVANAILLPHGMEYNFEVCKEKFAELAPVMGENVTGKSIDEAARGAIAAVRRLGRQLNALNAMAVRLKDAGVPEESLPAIAEAATEDGAIVYNPREVVAEEILVHLKNAY
ncbi:iron-containing alcohol dehydrogenase [Desulfosarcina sp.]|uniref:iron-containing alcohol dehydrogenase n=1 Tax=Desulfosarcina sp. TaxID=2027861 RepID=UPI0029B1532E|nr:iron-containing alcohol dehydrogenase [Desulfosarcina sp.]MDX2455612.1 iron-containing alcohol dehydrogenase [Desulfosarcina sp.]MDX2493082.1 iron-containing alcohol dehydrogenase [Desulfosarcina sp.]